MVQGGNGGTGTGGDLNIQGSQGRHSTVISTSIWSAGQGADTIYGSGGKVTVSVASSGFDATGYGAGGGGASGNSGDGGNGAGGLIIITEYCSQ